MNFLEKLDEGMKMKNIKSVAWKVKGEDYFEPEKVQVHFTDEEGKNFDLVIHDQPWFKGWHNEESVILNALMHKWNILPDSMIIGFTCDIAKAINYCRKQIPYSDVFFVNEEKCRMYDHVIPEHIF